MGYLKIDARIFFALNFARIPFQIFLAVKFLNISVCACIPTVKKHALISEGVLIFECFV